MFRWIFIAWIVIAPVSWFLGDYVRESVIEEMITASQNNDVAAMANRFAWDDLRVWLKEDIAEAKRNLGANGAMLGPTPSKINEVVDYYVQPENIDIVYYYHDLLFPNLKEEDFIQSTGYYPPFGFYVTLGYPEEVTTGNAALLPVMRDRIKARFVFGLDGLTWRVKQMHVPIFMVPKNTYPQPAVDRFGNPCPGC